MLFLMGSLQVLCNILHFPCTYLSKLLHTFKMIIGCDSSAKILKAVCWAAGFELPVGTGFFSSLSCLDWLLAHKPPFQ
jgi:hypothetical protein